MKKKLKKSSKKSPKKTVKKTAPKGGIMPIGNRVLVRPIKEEAKEEVTSFGIIIPVTVTEKDKEELPERGVVVAVGSGKYGDDNKLIPVSVKVGDTVMYSTSYGSKKIKIGGVEHYLITEDEILAVIN